MISFPDEREFGVEVLALKDEDVWREDSGRK